MTSQQAGWALALSCMLVGSAWALPEGTPQLGLTQGLDANTTVRVRIAEGGETIRVCSSDDGIQEPDVADGDGRIDQTPGAPNPISADRIGAEIIAYAADAAECASFEDCDLGLPELCYVQPYGVTIETFRMRNEREPMGSERARCGRILTVVPDGPGACNAATIDPMYHELDAPDPGVWSFDFAGEQETRTRSGTSTRYFEIEVLRPDGSPVDGGRVHSLFWQLNAHDFEYGTDADFFAISPVGGGARVFVIDFDQLKGFRYTVVANDDGLVDHPDQSWCEFGDPDGDRNCPAEGEAQRQLFYSQYVIYLNYPDPAPQPPGEPFLGVVEFNDEAGTVSISPDGDGVQDEGRFSFTPNMRGIWRIIIDTDGDGAFDATRDRILRGRSQMAGDRIDVRFDGLGRDGAPLPPGEYPVRLELNVGETHFPMADIEDNSTGFVIWEQTGPDPAQRRALPMLWDDTAIVPAAAEDQPDGYRVTGWPDGSSVPPNAHEPRAWVQPGWPGDDFPVVFDTAVAGTTASTTEFDCRRCDAAVTAIVIGPENDSGDRDGDGIADDDEDLDGDGEVDPGETDPDLADTDGDGLDDRLELFGANPTDPTRADTDGDGLTDGTEDANANGQVDEGETDPNIADTDGDGLFDGAEDANANGVVDPGESDPRDDDTDDDGIIDGEDDNPTVADVDPDAGPDAEVDPIVDMGADGRLPADARLDVSLNDDDGGRDTNLNDIGDDGCGCASADRDPVGLLGLLVIVTLGIRRRRRV